MFFQDQCALDDGCCTSAVRGQNASVFSYSCSLGRWTVWLWRCEYKHCRVFSKCIKCKFCVHFYELGNKSCHWDSMQKVQYWPIDYWYYMKLWVIIICFSQVDSANPNMYINAIIAVSTFLSFYGYLLFYEATKRALPGYSIRAKFICVIVILVLCGLQSGILETMGALNIIPCSPPFSDLFRSQCKKNIILGLCTEALLC